MDFLICSLPNRKRSGGISHNRKITLLPLCPMFAKPFANALLGATVCLASTVFLALAIPSRPTIAQTCASNCPPTVLQFTPGQFVQIQVVNKTRNVVGLEKLAGKAPIFLKPGEGLRFRRGGATDPNVSIVFWDTTGVFLKAKLVKTGTDKLQVELRPGGENPGDRSVYIKNDGRVDVF
jgi:hypothetical protein